MSLSRDTIFALSSGRPPAAIAVIRLSGPRAGAALEAVMGRRPEPRRGSLAVVRDPATGEIIDEALALWFPAPRSETGEDMAELQVHGGRAVIGAVLAVLGAMDGLRPAEPGEFTRRAFENGRMDLTAVEGLADLIDADTAAQRRQALRQLKGLLGDRTEEWRQRLIEAMALIEARIDFSDEGDVPEDLVEPALAVARILRGEIADALAGAARGERLREGLVVAIAGPPNAGKSTLLNRIARREVAIVSPVAGTTRDVIEVRLDLDGYPVTLLDTAGIRDSEDAIEREGVRRARQRAAEADLVLWVTDASAPQKPALDDGQMIGSANEPAPIWLVKNKADLLAGRINEIKNDNIKDEFILSCKEGFGLDGLISNIAIYAGSLLGGQAPALITRARHRAALTEARDSLGRALAHSVGSDELIAEDLRLAARSLGRLTGRVDVEDILDSIFRDFCIGK